MARNVATNRFTSYFRTIFSFLLKGRISRFTAVAWTLFTLAGCTSDYLYEEEDLFPALPPKMSLYFITPDSTGWQPLFPGPLKEGVLAGYHVDSVALFDENLQQMINYREGGAQGWYFPSVRYYWDRMLSLQDTVEQARRFTLKMNSIHTDTLDVLYRYKSTPMTRPIIEFEYVKFYLNSQLLEIDVDNSTKLYIPI